MMPDPTYAASPRKRGKIIYRTQETVWAVYAVHSDKILRFVAMCAGRGDADQLVKDMTTVADVYVLPHIAERYWRSPAPEATEPPVIADSFPMTEEANSTV